MYRLTSLQLLPLVMALKLNDILFLVNSLKNPSDHFNTYRYISMSTTTSRSSRHLKIKHGHSYSAKYRHSFFPRIPRLWNSLPSRDLIISLCAIKHQLNLLFFIHFISNFDPNNYCSYRFLCPCNKCTNIPSPPNFQRMHLAT